MLVCVLKFHTEHRPKPSQGTLRDMDFFSPFLQALANQPHHHPCSPFHLLLSYLLHPKDLCHLSQVSKGFSSHPLFDVLWKELCVRRWLSHRQHISETLCLKRGDGKDPSWKLTYKVWAHEMKIPHGKLMPIIQRIFGKSQRSDLDCWLYLRHANDCLLSQIQPQQSTGACSSPLCSVGNLRFCLQNTSLTPIQFHLHTSFQIYLKGSAGTCLPIHRSELSAKNGEIVEPGSMEESNQLVTLQYLDFVVITLQVLCPSEIINEVDLLSSLDRVHIIGWRSRHFHEAVPVVVDEKENEGEDSGALATVDINVYDEERIWDAYQTAPGGIILLRELSQMLTIR